MNAEDAEERRGSQRRSKRSRSASKIVSPKDRKGAKKEQFKRRRIANPLVQLCSAIVQIRCIRRRFCRPFVTTDGTDSTDDFLWPFFAFLSVSSVPSAVKHLVAASPRYAFASSREASLLRGIVRCEVRKKGWTRLGRSFPKGHDSYSSAAPRHRHLHINPCDGHGPRRCRHGDGRRKERDREA